MELYKGKFEKIEGHTVYGGESMSVPLFVSREGLITEESDALLSIVNIVGAKLAEQQTDVASFFDRIALRLSDNEGDGVTVEDTYGKGSINFQPHLTFVTVRELDSWKVATELVFEMAAAWAEEDA